MILEFGLKAGARRAMCPALIENAANVGGQWHKPEQMFAKQAFAILGAALSEHPSCGR